MNQSRTGEKLDSHLKGFKHVMRSYVVVTAKVKEEEPITLTKPVLHFYQLTKLSQALG